MSSNLNLRQLTLLPNFYWDLNETEVTTRILSGNIASPIYGQFSLIHEDAEHYYLIRDRLGLNKLFYHIDSITGVITVGHYLQEVASATGDYNQVLSVPAGHYLKINRTSLERHLCCYYDISRTQEDPEFNLPDFHCKAEHVLSEFFISLQSKMSHNRFFVCLSGGLDSSIIATYAKKYLKDVTAVTFTYKNLSDDFVAARAIANELDLPFFPIISERRMEEEMLEEVLSFGQDWRDFNVHCAWVNNYIGKQLRASFPDENVVILTGDLMNEYVADYKPVEFGNTLYYMQPKISRDKLRRFFVFGMDAGDRELGIFNHYGFATIQPYSLLAEIYLSIPGSYILMDASKERLNLLLLTNPAAGKHILKTKMRAQVGSRDGGTLGLFHDNGISQEDLEQRWRKIYSPLARESSLKPIIVSGRYRS